MSKTKKMEEELLINSSLTSEDKALYDSSGAYSDADKVIEEKVDSKIFLLSVTAAGKIKTVEVYFIHFLSYVRFISCDTWYDIPHDISHDISCGISYDIFKYKY